MSRFARKSVLALSSAILLFVIGLFLPGIWKIAALSAAWFIAGYPVVIRAVGGIFRGQLLDENFLMTVASLGAFLLGDFPEGAAVMLFFRIGEQFERYAVNRSRASIASLMDIRPDRANILRDGTEEEADPEEVKIGDLLRIRPGERIPVDGIVVEGSGYLDTASMTGESQPRDVHPGDKVISGCINLSGVLTVRAEETYECSAVGRVLELIETASERKARTERMITRFARIYTPLVVCFALLLSIVPPLLLSQPFSSWVRRGLTFLVISCPCALVISVPMSFFGGMGAASRSGIIVKGGAVLERLAGVRQIVFDKTGTLTAGSFAVSAVCPVNLTEDELLMLVASAEQYSGHPLAKAVCRHSDRLSPAQQVEEHPGYGLSAVVQGLTVNAGSVRYMQSLGISVPEGHGESTSIHAAIEGRYAGWIELRDAIRPDAAEALRRLRQSGTGRLIMLTGDTERAAADVAHALALDEFRAGLLPQEKVSHLEILMRDGGVTAFVGDGVNDAPVLAMADIGIAMGDVGSDAAVEAADLVILRDQLSALPKVVEIAAKTMRIAKQNIVFSLGVKLLVLILGAFGLAGMWLAVFADVGVSVLAILNAMRTLSAGAA